MRKNATKVVTVCLVASLTLGCIGCGSKKVKIEQDPGATMQISTGETNLDAGTAVQIEDPLKNLTKEELIETVHTMENQLFEAYEQVDLNKQKLDALTNGENPTAEITSVGTGEVLETLNSFNGRVLFPESLMYPNSTEAANTSSVNISKMVTIKPSNNWGVKLNAASVELEHSSGISGSLRVGAITDVYDRDKLIEDVMTPFFKNFPEQTIEYKKIFLDDYSWGVQGSLPLLIDGEDAYMICGILGFANTSVSYSFCYKGSRDSEKDEAVSIILNSMTVNGQQLRVE